MKRKNKGFTLVELLALIVILALIALIATPIILNVINDAKKQAAKDSFNDAKKQAAKDSFYENGTAVTAVYYNPETGKKCDDYTEKNSTTGTKSGCMKWYVFNDKEGNATVNVILDHNTTANVAWNLTGNNSEMKEVKKALENDTSNWKSGLKPRLITANEIAKITGNTGFDATQTGQDWFYLDSNNQTQTANSTKKSKYAWLFDYTDGCTSYGCNKADSSTYGYWTSSPSKDNSAYAWRVDRSGGLSSNYVTGTGYGIRPVITISKSDIS